MNRSEQQREILELLESEEQPMSPVQIARELKKNRSTIRRLPQKLYQDDTVRKALKGHYFVGHGQPNTQAS